MTSALAVCRHPLFSLLELLLQKCELATTTCSEQGKDGSPDYTRQTVNDEISAFAEKVSSVSSTSRVEGACWATFLYCCRRLSSRYSVVFPITHLDPMSIRL